MAAIKDVAKLAGFSPAAVSKYLKDPNSVRPATRERIEAAIRELNYVPSAAARSLRTGKTNLYLLMVSHLRNPYFVEQFLTLNEEANRRGFNLLVQTARLDEKEWDEDLDVYLPSIPKVDGIIVMIAKSAGIIAHTQKLATIAPTVTYSWPFACPGVDSVVVDAEGAIYETTQHLLRQGHTRIGYISDHRGEARQQPDIYYGYFRAMEEAGLPHPDELFEITIPSVQGGYQAAEKLMNLSDPPTAILCGNDVLATGCIQYARDHGISIPDQLAITGQDNCYLAKMSYPQITSTEAPNRIMAATAFDMLAQRRQAPEEPAHCAVYHYQLIERASSLCK